MLRCVKCGAEDYPVLDHFDVNGRPVLRHHVIHDGYPLEGRSHVTAEEKAQGFYYKLLNGVHAKFRDICGDCFQAQEETKSYRSAMQRELDKQQQDKNLKTGYYGALCAFDE